MNERIRELAEQSGFGAAWFEEAPVGHPSLPKEGILKEFAELIIKECLNLCYKRGMNDELYAGQLKAAAYIEEHFGVSA